MLFKRWITAIILIPFLLLILLKGSPLVFSFFMAAVTFVSMKEYFTIVSSPDFFSGTRGKESSGSSSSSSSHCTIPFKIKFCGYAASFMIIAAAHTGSAEMVMTITTLNIVAVFTSVLTDFSLDSNLFDDVAKEIQGVVYLPVFLCFLVFIRNSWNGALWVIWLWLVIAASDTGAYYCGTYLGKSPLAPKISPHKTMEGSAGGLAAAVAAGTIFGWIYLPDISILVSVIFAFTAAAAGQMGDLFESALKRIGHIKDSGTILPGHGGVLDRIDGLIFAAPVAFIFQWICMK